MQLPTCQADNLPLRLRSKTRLLKTDSSQVGNTADNSRLTKKTNSEMSKLLKTLRSTIVSFGHEQKELNAGNISSRNIGGKSTFLNKTNAYICIHCKKNYNGWYSTKYIYIYTGYILLVLFLKIWTVNLKFLEIDKFINTSFIFGLLFAPLCNPEATYSNVFQKQPNVQIPSQPVSPMRAPLYDAVRRLKLLQPPSYSIWVSNVKNLIIPFWCWYHIFWLYLQHFINWQCQLEW